MSTPASSASARIRRPAASRVAFALAVVAFAVGCGDDPASEPAPDADSGGKVVDVSGSEPVGEVRAGSVAPLVECRDWNRADAGEKLATIADVRAAINLEETGIEAPALTDEEATDIFDNACDAPYAQGFRLYKIYARAVGFIPLARELRE